jgi:gamma-glutamyltranspeptidase
MGGVQAIARDAAGTWTGAADPRREGADGAC